jgi:hypothetical protein
MTDESTDLPISGPAAPVSVFLSYRRSDTASIAGSLGYFLELELRPENVFRDIKTIEGGDHFPTEIDEALRKASVVVVLIGPGWVGKLSFGRSLITRHDDWIRFELEHAREYGKPILPVLVDGAVMPDERALPQSLRFITKWNAFRIRDEAWGEDVPKLVKRIRALAVEPAVEVVGDFPPAEAKRRWVIAGILSLLLATAAGWMIATFGRDPVAPYPPVAGDPKSAVVNVRWADTRARTYVSTGFFVTGTGYVLAAMVDPDSSASISVQGITGQSYPARLIAWQEPMLGLLKVTADSVPYLGLTLRPPQKDASVLVTGYTVLGEKWRTYTARVDTVINDSVYYTRREDWPGLSGGPIVDVDNGSAVVGMHYGGSSRFQVDTTEHALMYTSVGEGFTVRLLGLQQLLQKGRIAFQEDSVGILRLSPP